MAMSSLPLSYCTNVHPGVSVAEVDAGLDRYTAEVRRRVEALAAGLWLAEPVVRELLDEADGVRRFADRLAARDLVCYTLNAFPYGDFHSERVKEQVYLPDWADPRRLDYTDRCARVLAALLPDGMDGSISTVPLGFKGFDHAGDFIDRCIDQIIELARRLDRLHDATDRRIRLAIEPEPLCVIETTDEAVRFFDRLFDRADAAGAAVGVVTREHIGVCYDVCHQAVEFEDVTDSIAALNEAGVTIAKVHLSCALDCAPPGADEQIGAALRRFVEPRYLHQTFARLPDGSIQHATDLSEQLIDDADSPLHRAERWRIHFHVPVDAARLGPLHTTRPQLEQALLAVAQLHQTPHLEVETYTWPVLPGREKGDLVDGLTAEISAAHVLIDDLK